MTVTDFVDLSPVALKILDEIRSDHQPLNLNLNQPHDVTQALTGLCCFS